MDPLEGAIHIHSLQHDICEAFAKFLTPVFRFLVINRQSFKTYPKSTSEEPKYLRHVKNQHAIIKKTAILCTKKKYQIAQTATQQQKEDHTETTCSNMNDSIQVVSHLPILTSRQGYPGPLNQQFPDIVSITNIITQKPSELILKIRTSQATDKYGR